MDCALTGPFSAATHERAGLTQGSPGQDASRGLGCTHQQGRNRGRASGRLGLGDRQTIGGSGAHPPGHAGRHRARTRGAGSAHPPAYLAAGGYRGEARTGTGNAIGLTGEAPRPPRHRRILPKTFALPSSANCNRFQSVGGRGQAVQQEGRAARSHEGTMDAKSSERRKAGYDGEDVVTGTQDA